MVLRHWLGLALLLFAAPAKAYLIEQNVSLTYEAGVFCNGPPDRIIPAPNTFEGEVEFENEPYKFFHLGDKAPSLPGVAIGVVLQLKSFRPGETLTIRQFRFEDMRRPDTWTLVPRDDGLLWAGTMPAPGYSLDYGRYQTQILRGEKKLFVFQFSVVPAETVPEIKANCVPNTS